MRIDGHAADGITDTAVRRGPARVIPVALGVMTMRTAELMAGSRWVAMVMSVGVLMF
jgi:hypothetical protein